MKRQPREADLKLAKKVVELLLKKYDIDKAILFGSRARGDAKRWSDYDILVLLDFDSKSYIKSADLMGLLTENGFTQDIQILARTVAMYELDTLLKRSIDAEGVVIYERNN